MKLKLLIVSITTLLLTACTGIQPLTQVDAAVTGEQAAADTVDAEVAIDLLDPAEAMPLDPVVRIGVLDNGLTYYIRQNTEPENRAELWLAVNAGSLQEDDDQLGRKTVWNTKQFVQCVAHLQAQEPDRTNGARRYCDNTTCINQCACMALQCSFA